MSKPFEPMKAASKIPNLEDIKYPCMASFKLDGIRCAARHGKPMSRNMKVIPNKYVQQVFEEHQLHGFDGELYLCGDHEFNKAQSAFMSVSGKPAFYLASFDWTHEQDIHLPFIKRIRAGYEAARPDFVYWLVQHVIDTPEELTELYNEALNRGYEGLVVRDMAGPYKFGRSTLNQGYALKLKPFEDAEGIVVGVEELMHNADTSTKQKHNLYGGGVMGKLIVGS